MLIVATFLGLKIIDEFNKDNQNTNKTGGGSFDSVKNIFLDIDKYLKENKMNDLNNNISNQIALISQNTKKSEEVAQKTLELESKLAEELSKIDQQIDGYKKETETLTVNISNLNNEILNLENEEYSTFPTLQYPIEIGLLSLFFTA